MTKKHVVEKVQSKNVSIDNITIDMKCESEIYEKVCSIFYCDCFWNIPFFCISMATHFDREIDVQIDFYFYYGDEAKDDSN